MSQTTTHELPLIRTDELPLTIYKKHVAKALNRSERSVERLIRAGRLPEPLPLPGRMSWNRDAFLAWLSGGTPFRRARRA